MRGAQASEMDAGKGRSRRTWKWALYIASEVTGLGLGNAGYRNVEWSVQGSMVVIA